VLFDLGCQILLLDEKEDGWLKWKTLQLVDEKRGWMSEVETLGLVDEE
jgi:hypothetical protein